MRSIRAFALTLMVAVVPKAFAKKFGCAGLMDDGRRMIVEGNWDPKTYTLSGPTTMRVFRAWPPDIHDEIPKHELAEFHLQKAKDWIILETGDQDPMPIRIEIFNPPQDPLFHVTLNGETQILRGGNCSM